MHVIADKILTCCQFRQVLDIVCRPHHMSEATDKRASEVADGGSGGGNVKESLSGLTGGGSGKGVVDSVKDLTSGGSEGQSFKDLSGMQQSYCCVHRWHAAFHPTGRSPNIHPCCECSTVAISRREC
jgi:hypothetical protein